jgi:hypothetical protein
LGFTKRSPFTFCVVLPATCRHPAMGLISVMTGSRKDAV